MMGSFLPLENLRSWSGGWSFLSPSKVYNLKNWQPKWLLHSGRLIGSFSRSQWVLEYKLKLFPLTCYLWRKAGTGKKSESGYLIASFTWLKNTDVEDMTILKTAELPKVGIQGVGMRFPSQRVLVLVPWDVSSQWHSTSAAGWRWPGWWIPGSLTAIVGPELVRDPEKCGAPRELIKGPWPGSLGMFSFSFFLFKVCSLCEMTNPEVRLIDLGKKISALSRQLLPNFVHHFLHNILRCFPHDYQEKSVSP